MTNNQVQIVYTKVYTLKVNGKNHLTDKQNNKIETTIISNTFMEWMSHIQLMKIRIIKLRIELYNLELSFTLENWNRYYESSFITIPLGKKKRPIVFNKGLPSFSFNSRAVAWSKIKSKSTWLLLEIRTGIGDLFSFRGILKTF